MSFLVDVAGGDTQLLSNHHWAKVASGFANSKLSNEIQKKHAYHWQDWAEAA